MMEKTIEELQAELEALKKRNLEVELAKEIAKAEDEQKLQKEKEMEKMREEIRKEVMENMAAESKITEKDSMKLDSPKSDLLEFKDTFVKKLGLTGRPYEDVIKDICYGGYKN